MWCCCQGLGLVLVRVVIVVKVLVVPLVDYQVLFVHPFELNEISGYLIPKLIGTKLKEKQ